MNSTSCRCCGAALPALRGPGRPRVWCSEACRVAWFRADGGAFIAQRATPRACAHCAAVFMPKRYDATYCSRECGWRHRSAQLVPHPVGCAVCKAPFSALKGRNTCSDACRMVSFKRSWAKVRSAPTPRPCRDCGAATTRHANSAAGPLCEACIAVRRRDRNRRKNTRRRGVPTPMRRIGVYELARRDGWRCHLCARRVSDRFVAPHPKSPTADHLIPVVDGGTDEPENLRLAHLGCNSRRGARGSAQLLLFG